VPGRIYAATWGRAFAWGYDRFMAAAERKGLRDARHELLREAMGDCLELGAGTGLNLDHWPPRVERLVLTEPDPHMVGQLRRKVARARVEAEVVEAPGEALPFPDDSFDTVIVTLVLCTVPDPPDALAEVARVLRRDGALVLLWNTPAGPWEPSPAAAERLLTERGPKPEEISYDPLDLDGPHYTSGGWRRPFDYAPFAPLCEVRLPNPQTLDREGLVAFFASMGWLGDLPDAERLPLLDDVRSLLPAAEYRRLWETHVHWTRRA
jgi:SAM-dependent methyltransferase